MDVLRFYFHPTTGEPHIYEHGVTEQEVEQVLANPGDVRFRWRIGCDGSVSDQGWWVDDVRVATLTMCTSAELIFTDGFESGDTSGWSLVIP